jgi:serine/threonine protein kinase
MAPELLGGKDPYDGPAVDIFACGAILFILRYAKFAFAASNDSYFRRLHRNPQQAMIDRNIKASPEFLDLIVGLTQQDPKKRLTLEQVKAHPWLKGETAKPNEVRAHFYSLVPGRKCLNKDHYKAM